ncbi:MAG: hypothetical protein K1X88_15220 [Nannocystaceae bacterium]|nr:hypothetical protein [Nannocystaceae bacterium]
MRVCLVAAIASLLAGCGPGAYACEASSQCVDAGVAGMCQPSGWCSFPDPACGSGQRYGDHAGDGLGGDCVDVDTGTGSGGGTGTSAGSVGSVATTLDGGVEATSGGGGSSGNDSEGSTGATMSTTAPATTTNATTSASTTLTTTTDPAMCGDGVMNADEECDGEDFGGSSCESLGYAGGSLSCAADCTTLDLSGCLGCGGPGGACMPFGQCGEQMPCDDVFTCIAIGNPIGTCMPPCGAGCADGTVCNVSFDTCGIDCQSDIDCPRGMSCTQLLNDEFACLW